MPKTTTVTEMEMPPPAGYRLNDGELLGLTRQRVDDEIVRLEGELADPGATGTWQQNGRAVRLERSQRKLRLLRQLARELASALPRDLSADGAGLGSLLTLEDCVTGEYLEYTLMSGEDIDIAAGQVSLASAIGQAVLGARTGAVVEVRLPRGLRSYRVVALATLPAALGIVPPLGRAAPRAGRGVLAGRRRSA